MYKKTVVSVEFRLSVNKKRKAQVCLFSKLLQNMPEGLASVKKTKPGMVLGWRVAEIL